MTTRGSYLPRGPKEPVAEFETIPAPSWVVMPGWAVLGILPRHDAFPDRYLMECLNCEKRTRRQRRVVDKAVRDGKAFACRGCSQKRPEKAGRFCGKCCDLPHRRPYPACECGGKPGELEEPERPERSLVGSQLSGVAEVMSD